MQPLLELGFGPDQDVLRETHAPQGSIAYFAILLFARSVVGHHNHDVVIAIRTRIAARRRTEQVDAQRVIHLYQAPHHLGQQPGRQQTAV